MKASKKPTALIVAIEDDIADIGIIRQYGIDYYGPNNRKCIWKEDSPKKP